jgi:hypothetical protein
MSDLEVYCLLTALLQFLSRLRRIGGQSGVGSLLQRFHLLCIGCAKCRGIGILGLPYG